ncbi:MAG TPA: hypothetical protein VGG98_10560 [Solirubrobacteraceae bacterium]|jgi:glutamate formiminotransferase/glutamate formiminotransferase/formiminotetrahydrofolate cyclodeaminase
MTPPILLAVPNVSEGRDRHTIAMIAQAFTTRDEPKDQQASRVRLLDVHSDVDHHRSVFTLVGDAGDLVDGLLSGMREAIEHVNVVSQAHERGEHPHVGAVDVVPLVYLDEQTKGVACAAALVAADRIGEELGIPVFLYGELAAGRSRAELRRGGVEGLARRMRGEEAFALSPDFGPRRMHARAGATLVAARPPLVAFNLQLAAPATVTDARRIAGLIREGGAEGLPGVRAIGVPLSGGVGQVSMNVERPLEIPLAAVVEAVGRHAAVQSAELVGLAPRAAMEGFPEDLPLPGFDPDRQLIENALG